MKGFDMKYNKKRGFLQRQNESWLSLVLKVNIEVNLISTTDDDSIIRPFTSSSLCVVMCVVSQVLLKFILFIFGFR